MKSIGIQTLGNCMWRTIGILLSVFTGCWIRFHVCVSLPILVYHSPILLALKHPILPMLVWFLPIAKCRWLGRQRISLGILPTIGRLMHNRWRADMPSMRQQQLLGLESNPCATARSFLCGFPNHRCPHGWSRWRSGCRIPDRRYLERQHDIGEHLLQRLHYGQSLLRGILLSIALRPTETFSQLFFAAKNRERQIQSKFTQNQMKFIVFFFLWILWIESKIIEFKIFSPIRFTYNDVWLKIIFLSNMLDNKLREKSVFLLLLFSMSFDSSQLSLSWVRRLNLSNRRNHYMHVANAQTNWKEVEQETCR